MSNVRSYTDKQLLNRVSEMEGFKGFPKGYWIIGVQSEEDEFNKFDDKFYLFRGDIFILVTSGTTNSGATGLLNYMRFKLKGTAVWKTDELYYDLYKGGLHRGKQRALRQQKPVKFYRDSNLDRKSDQQGKLYEGIIGVNFHFNSYRRNTIKKWFIGGWSIGCQVCNDEKDYYEIINLTYNQRSTTYCLLKEF